MWANLQRALQIFWSSQRFFPSVLNLFYYLHKFTVFVAFFVFVNSVSAKKYCPEWFGSWMLWNVHFLIQKWFYIMSKVYVPFHPSENPSQQIFGQSLSARLHQKCTVWRLGNRCKCLFFLSVCPDVNRGHITFLLPSHCNSQMVVITISQHWNGFLWCTFGCNN